MPGAWAGLSSQRASAAPQFAGGQPIEMARGIGGIWNAAPSVKPSAMSGTMTEPMAEQVPGAMEGTAAPVREAYRPTPQQEAKWARIEEAAHVQDARDATAWRLTRNAARKRPSGLGNARGGCGKNAGDRTRTRSCGIMSLWVRFRDRRRRGKTWFRFQTTRILPILRGGILRPYRN